MASITIRDLDEGVKAQFRGSRGHRLEVPARTEMAEPITLPR